MTGIKLTEQSRDISSATDAISNTGRNHRLIAPVVGKIFQIVINAQEMEKDAKSVIQDIIKLEMNVENAQRMEVV